MIVAAVYHERCVKVLRDAAAVGFPALNCVVPQVSFFFQAEAGIRFLTVTGVQTCALPISVLMPAVPARVAGVREIVLVTPAGPGGRVEPAILGAARLAGVTEGYRLGGAQAVAALAYGTATIRRVDKIVGPGNIYVALAKARVFGEVGIDMVAGPSEIVVVADRAA